MFSKKAGEQVSKEQTVKASGDSLEAIEESFRIITGCCQFLRLKEIQQSLQDIKTATAPELERENEIKNLKGTIDTISDIKNKQIKKIEEDKNKMILKLEEENKKLKEEVRLVAEEKQNVAREKTKLNQTRQAEEKKYSEKSAKLEKQKKEELEKEKKKAHEEYQKKAKAEKSDLQATVQKLQKEKADTSKSNEELDTEVKRLKVYRDSIEKKNKTLEAEVNKLQETLRTLNAETAVSRTPFIDYKNKVEHLYQLIGGFAQQLSENVPEKVEFVLGPLGSQGKLGKASRIFYYASSSSSEVAVALRRAAVQNFIARELDSIFQNKLLISCGTNNSDGHNEEAILNTISAVLNSDDEKVWRGMTVKALDKLSKYSGTTRIIEQVAQETIDKLQPFIHDNEQENAVRADVAEIIEAALKIWSLRRNDSCTITMNSAPSLKNDGSWNAWVAEEDAMLPPFSSPSNDTNGANGSAISNGPPSPTSSTLLSSTTHPKTESYVIFPQIIGEFDQDDTSVDRGATRKRERAVLHRGVALFSDSPMFDRGLCDIQALKDDVRNIHHRRRVSSLSSPTTMTNRPFSNGWPTQSHSQNSSGEPAG